jgi:hypothetical protein
MQLLHLIFLRLRDMAAQSPMTEHPKTTLVNCPLPLAPTFWIAGSIRIYSWWNLIIIVTYGHMQGFSTLDYN